MWKTCWAWSPGDTRVSFMFVLSFWLGLCFCYVVVTVLCCAVLCCAVLPCAVLCCAVLCCAALCCSVLCYVGQCGVGDEFHVRSSDRGLRVPWSGQEEEVIPLHR